MPFFRAVQIRKSTVKNEVKKKIISLFRLSIALLVFLFIKIFL